MVPGISAIVENDCLNFVPVRLCNTYAVVDAHALYRELKRRQTSIQGYGIGPLQMAALFKNTVDALLKCNIRPIFLFPGLYNRIPTEWHSKIDRLRKSMSKPTIPSRGTPPDHFVCKSGNCNCDLNTLVAVLEELNVRYIFTAEFIVGVAAAISVLLDCPLFATHALYYVMSCKTAHAHNDIASRLKYYPLSGLSFTPVPLESAPDANCPSYILEGHLYNPQESFLSALSPISCRVFSLLWNDSVIASLVSSSHVAQLDLHHSGVESVRKHASNARRLAQWLGEVGPFKAIQNAVELIDNSELQTSLSQCIPELMRRTQFDLREALLILEEVQMATSLDATVCEPLSLAAQENSESRSLISPVRTCDPILSHWPQRMLKAYRHGFVCPFILSSLYVEWGEVFLTNFDYVAGWPSTYLKALTIRYVTYCLMYGYELSVGGCAHLHGAKPNLIEIHPLNSETVKVISLTLKKVNLPDCQMNLNFVYECFSYTANANLADWLNLFSLCLLIWYKQKSAEAPELRGCSPGDCPLIIAACVCALAQSFNSAESWESVLAKYESVSERAQTMANCAADTSTSDDLTLRQSGRGQWIMHSLLEIQNIYTEMIVLCNFIRTLSFYNSTSDSLEDSDLCCRPTHQVFTSNKLFYCITNQLYSLPTEGRSYKAIRDWLPQLLLYSSGENLSERCIVVVTDLTNLLQHLHCARIQLMEISQAESEAPIAKIVSMSKSGDNMRQRVESLLQPEALGRRATVESELSATEEHLPVRGQGGGNKKYSPSQEALSNSLTEEDNGPSEKKAEHHKWERKKIDADADAGAGAKGVHVNTVSFYQMPSKNSKTPTRWRRTGGGYATILKKRVGIE